MLTEGGTPPSDEAHKGFGQFALRFRVSGVAGFLFFLLVGRYRIPHNQFVATGLQWPDNRLRTGSVVVDQFGCLGIAHFSIGAAEKDSDHAMSVARSGCSDGESCLGEVARLEAVTTFQF